jgi:hypothetical protein
MRDVQALLLVTSTYPLTIPLLCCLLYACRKQPYFEAQEETAGALKMDPLGIKKTRDGA